MFNVIVMMTVIMALRRRARRKHILFTYSSECNNEICNGWSNKSNKEKYVIVSRFVNMI